MRNISQQAEQQFVVKKIEQLRKQRANKIDLDNREYAAILSFQILTH
jgi:hypothetical protein